MNALLRLRLLVPAMVLLGTVVLAGCTQGPGGTATDGPASTPVQAAPSAASSAAPAASPSPSSSGGKADY